MELKIGLLGCGTVGGGVVELIRMRADKIAAMTGFHPVITDVLVRDLDKKRNVEFLNERLTHQAKDILDNDEIKVVIETMGGIEPAKTMILAALRAGKHVITANKDLIALHGAEIMEVAEQEKLDFLYEAAVGGAIPLIRPLKESLTANEITDLKGIINGTTNYILTKMTESGANYEDVLREAQDLGYAESDPSGDVDGLDAARKLTILASIAFGAKVSLDDVEVHGIRTITAADVAYAHELGTVIKLLAVGKDNGTSLSLQVRPTLVPKTHPLAQVNDAFNALFVHGDAAGDLMFFGRGAGSLPTASAMVGDVIETLRNMSMAIPSRFRTGPVTSKPVKKGLSEPFRYYLRIHAKDKPGVFAHLASIFASTEISMETVLQKRAHANQAEIVIVTHETTSSSMEATINQLNELSDLLEIKNVMLMEKGDA
jgi:homoserine dehydrogenase